MRIKIAQIVVGDYHLLILDEPTNHLDLANKIELEKALINFPGAVVMASHDKYLLSKVTNKVFVFADKSIQRYEEGYDEFSKRDGISAQSFKTDEKSIEERLRIIKEQMADPSKTEEQIEKLLKMYYDLQDIQASMKDKKPKHQM